MAYITFHATSQIFKALIVDSQQVILTVKTLWQVFSNVIREMDQQSVTNCGVNWTRDSIVLCLSSTAAAQAFFKREFTLLTHSKRRRKMPLRLLEFSGPCCYLPFCRHSSLTNWPAEFICYPCRKIGKLKLPLTNFSITVWTSLFNSRFWLFPMSNNRSNFKAWMNSPKMMIIFQIGAPKFYPFNVYKRSKKKGFRGQFYYSGVEQKNDAISAEIKWSFFQGSLCFCYLIQYFFQTPRLIDQVFAAGAPLHLPRLFFIWWVSKLLYVVGVPSLCQQSNC